MKLNNNLLYMLLITIGILGLLVGLHKKKENYNIKNSLTPIIQGGKRILSKEHFQTYGERAAAAKEKEEKETTSKPVASEEESQDNDENLTELMDHLDHMEKKCTEYENREKEKINQETEDLQTKYKAQLEIENDKIEQLKDLVNYYRKRYYKKLKINNKCRSEMQSKLDNDTEFIKDLKDKAQDNQIKLNVNAKELLEKIQY